MESRDLVTTFYGRVVEQGELALIDELFDDGFVLHQPGGTTRMQGLRAGVTMLRDGFEGLRFELHEVLGDGDRVAARWTLHGRHIKPVYGMQPSGREVSQDGMVFYRVHDGRLAEQWLLIDPGALGRAA